MSLSAETIVLKTAPTDQMVLILENWKQKIDVSDQEYLSQIENLNLEKWDHRSLLRLAFILLRDDGRRVGLANYFRLVRKVADHLSARDPKTSKAYHETITYFWIQMVHFAIASTNPLPSNFMSFILLNPNLVNEQLYLNYYSTHLINSTDSNLVAALPDLKPLPSIVPKELAIPSSEFHSLVQIQPIDIMSDGKLVSLFLQNSLPAWGHHIKLRVLYILLLLEGREKGGIDRILNIVQKFEGEHFHLTETYFWIQIMTYQMTLYEKKYQVSSLWRLGLLTQQQPYETSSPTLKSYENDDALYISMESQENDASEFLLEQLLMKMPSYENFIEKLNIKETTETKSCHKKVQIPQFHFDLLVNNIGIINQFYSKRILESSQSKYQFQIPDLQSLPTLVK